MPPAGSEPHSRSVRSRILLAIALTVAFYTMSFLIVAVLIAVPIVMYATTGQGNIFVAFATIAAAIAILRSMSATRSEFEAPGPELSRHEQPELHALVEEVAAATGERVPDAVYLGLAVNAGVSEPRRQRFLILGLPLMATLDRDELRAVVAHEMAHYAGGDTRFEAWIWRSRIALLQTASAVSGSKSWTRQIAAVPFVAYARLFLKITNAISRRSEFEADAVSARVSSPAAAGRALRRLAAIGPAFAGYMSGDVMPMLNAGKLPLVTDGFIALAANAELAPKLDELVSADLGQVEPDPYASHPTLGERLEALGQPPEETMPPVPGDPSSTLLRDLPKLERALLVHQLGPEIEALEPCGWDQAGAVHLAHRREMASKYGELVASDATIGDAGQLASAFSDGRSQGLEREASRMREELRALEPVLVGLPDSTVDGLAVDFIAAMVIAAAADAGAEITAPPGEPVRIRVRGYSLDPHHELADLATGDQPAERWAELVAPTGLTHVPLRPRAQQPAPEPTTPATQTS
jgi:Zn-dependent protease with chaperone function